MSNYSNYHCHSAYSDGQGKPADFVLQALALSMKTIGFSEHAPVPFNTFWNMPVAKTQTYLSEVNQLKLKYAGIIEIYTGLEVDYYAPYGLQIRESACLSELDFSIGSIHFLNCFADGKPWNTDSTQEEFDMGFKQIYQSDGNKLIESYYSAVINMLNFLKPNIVGHIDKIKLFNTENQYFDEKAPYYRHAVNQVLKAIKNNNCIVEFNTRGLYKHKNRMPYPSLWLLKQMHQMNLPVCINSDCHSPFEIVLAYDEAIQLLKEAGYKSQWQLRSGKWVEMAL